MCFVLCLGYPNSLYPLVALACSYWKQDFGSPPENEVRSWPWDCCILATTPPGRASLVAQIVKNLPATQETWVWSLGQADPLEKETATYSSILAWRIPWTEEPGLKSTVSQRVRHDWATHTFTLTSPATQLTHGLFQTRDHQPVCHPLDAACQERLKKRCVSGADG